MTSLSILLGYQPLRLPLAYENSVSETTTKMNALTTMKRRLRAVYKPRRRHKNSGDRNGTELEVRETLQDNTSPTSYTASSFTTDSSLIFQTQEVEVHDQYSKAFEGDPSNGVKATDKSSTAPQNDFGGVETECDSKPDEEIEESHGDVNSETLGPEDVDEQAIREKAYVFSMEEEPDDYTNGPARLVAASDGLKQCFALLLTCEFSIKIREALWAQRDFAKRKRAATMQLEAILNLQFDLDAEIANHNCRLAALRRVEQADSAEQDSLEHEVSVLELMLQDTEVQRQCVRSELENRAKILREIQAEANAYLEEAFVCGKLMEPESDEPDTPIEDKDLQNEYRLYCENLQREYSEEPIVPLDVGRDHLRAATLSSEEQAKADVREAYWSASSNLQSAQQTFDRRELDRAQAYQANCNAAAHGEEPADASPDEFDLKWVTIFQHLTRRVIEAENAFEEEKENARRAGVDVGTANQTSDFVDHAEDDTAQVLSRTLSLQCHHRRSRSG